MFSQEAQINLEEPMLPRRAALGYVMKATAALLLTGSSTERAQVVCTKPAGGPGAALLPDVVLQNQQGQTVRFYSDLVQGKIFTLNFFYTSCDSLCPRMMHNLVQLQRLLGKRAGTEVFMYSITLDPKMDTPRVLKRYADELGIQPGWMLLTGSSRDVEVLRRRLKFTDPDPIVDKQRDAHTGLLRYGNEKLDRWAGCPAMSSPAEIVRYLSWLEPVTVQPGMVRPEM